MNISKYIAFAAVAAVATGAFADAGPIVHYATDKNTMDHYADGTPVKRGEWYALGWSADGVFEGVTADYKPMGAGDEILKMRTTYREGDDFYTFFGINSKDAKTTGQYCVILLDTRDADGNPAPETSKGSGVPARNALAAMAGASYVAVSAGVGGGSTGTQTDVTSANWASTATPTTTAKISGIEVKGGKVWITVEDMSKGARYNVQSGDAPSAVTKYEIDKPEQATSETKTIEIPVEEGSNGKFFKLTPEPMVRPNAE